MAANWIRPVFNWIVKGLCGGDEHGGTAEGNNTSSNVSCSCFNNVICCGKVGNSTPAFQTPAQQNKGLQYKSPTKKDPAAQPKGEVAESSSTQSKEGDEDPSSLINSNEEKTPTSSESVSGSSSFHSTLSDVFEDF